MRTVRGNHLSHVMRNGKLFVVSALVLSSIVSLQSMFSPIATAVALDETLTIPPAPKPELTTQPVLYMKGTPTSETPSHLKSAEAVLHWTPTGSGERQDIYNLRFSSTDTLQEDGTLQIVEPAIDEVVDAEPSQNQNGLTIPEYPLSVLPEATYYWQVQSCDSIATMDCSDWSEVWSLTIDDTPPAVPTGKVASGSYDTTVRLAGTAEPKSTLTVTVGEESCTTTVDEAGDWTCTFVNDFDYGDYTADVKAADTAENASAALMVNFSVKELFVAPAIVSQQLPTVIEIVEVAETPRNEVRVLPVTSAIDIASNEDDEGEVAGAVAPLTTEGGIVQSSENGWQLLGLPWFVWVGIGGVLFAGWYVISSTRRSRAIQVGA